MAKGQILQLATRFSFKHGRWKKQTFSPLPSFIKNNKNKHLNNIRVYSKHRFRFESCFLVLFFCINVDVTRSPVSWLELGVRSEPAADRLSHKTNTSVTGRTSWVGGAGGWVLTASVSVHAEPLTSEVLFQNFHHSKNMRMGTLFFSHNIYPIHRSAAFESKLVAQQLACCFGSASTCSLIFFFTSLR